MLDNQTLLVRIVEMHQALATLPVAQFDAAITRAIAACCGDGAVACLKANDAPAERVGIVISSIAHCSYYKERAFAYPTLLLLRFLHQEAQRQHVQWASELTPWEYSFRSDMADALIPYYSHMSTYGLLGVIATESRDEPAAEHIEWLHRALMHLCVFCYLRGIDLVSEVKSFF